MGDLFSQISAGSRKKQDTRNYQESQVFKQKEEIGIMRFAFKPAHGNCRKRLANGSEYRSESDGKNKP